MGSLPAQRPFPSLPRHGHMLQMCAYVTLGRTRSRLSSAATLVDSQDRGGLSTNERSVAHGQRAAEALKRHQ